MDFVVRGGIATADSLQKGYRQHQGMPHIYGLSVQYAPGRSMPLHDLAQAGHIQNGQISYATPDELERAVAPLGYKLGLIRSPGIGHHHTLCVVYDASNTMLQLLPRDAAEALSARFHRQPNPALQP
jgi:hypothetical protein